MKNETNLLWDAEITLSPLLERADEYVMNDIGLLGLILS